MKTYELPSGDGLSPAEAAAKLNAVSADMHADGEHPLLNKEHPQHQNFLEAWRGLKSAETPTPADEPLEDDER